MAYKKEGRTLTWDVLKYIPLIKLIPLRKVEP